MSWTDERVSLLAKLWTEGLSASQIAAQLGGVTRNAVIGKVHRLGLSGRGKTASRPAAPRAKPARTPKQPRPAAPTVGNAALKIEAEAQPDIVPVAELKSATITELPPVSKRANIMALNEKTCRWPIGDPTHDDFHYCGCQAASGSPYCTYHTKLAFQPVSDRRRKVG
ncbi:MAG: GcrA family cell cycle regulator [Pseudomonadota bacterium]